MGFDVFGMCNALIDLQAPVTDELLQELNVNKNSMQLVDNDQSDRVLERIGGLVTNVEAGGSGANTMIGIAQMGGVSCFSSSVGQDEMGDRYIAGLELKHVTPSIARKEGHTGTSIILITPDAERTMLTCLGASRDMTDDDLDVSLLKRSRTLYVTGYMWDTPAQKSAVRFAMETAKERGIQVAFSLADPFCVVRHKSDFEYLIKNYVDIVIGNGDEMRSLVGCNDPLDAVEELAQGNRIAAVTMGASGSMLVGRGQKARINAHVVTAVDTTGAGDMFASGLLYGLTRGFKLNQCGEIASYASGEVVSRMGPRLDQLNIAHLV